MKVAHSVLKSLTDLTDVKIDLSEMERASDYFDQQVNHLVEQDPKLLEVISKLEDAYRRSEKVSPGSNREGGLKEEKVVYIQAFLKRQDDGEKKES